MTSLNRVQLVLILVLAAAAPVSNAANGQTEINQASALAGGVNANDAAGFPVEIDEPGSYVLTSNLTVSDVNTDAIQITAPGVNIDMNGFAVIGPVTCTDVGANVFCDSSGSGDGIQGGALVSVRDGIIRGFGRNGISLGNDANLQDLTLRANAGDGLSAGTGARVHVVVTHANGSDGIVTGGDSSVSASVSYGNFDYGIRLFGGSIVQSAVRRNGLTGILIPATRGTAAPIATIEGNAVSINGQRGEAANEGIQFGIGTPIIISPLSVESSLAPLGPTPVLAAPGPILPGPGPIIPPLFFSDAEGAVIGNAVYGNSGTGIAGGNRVGITNNVISGNGATITGVVPMFPNLCDSSLVCP